ncbi:MAG: hypothetical protein OXU23_26190 [Candidatus Poribacteria bacterium]|nr:hypothetical protein [Candidatus Poribacteria bacterium]
MKTTVTWNLLKLLLMLGVVCSFAFTADAQNYYPATIGNEWVLESTDGKQRQTYTLEKPEDFADQEFILLKIATEAVQQGKVIDTDKYFVTVDDEGIKLHKTVLQQTIVATVATAAADLPTPVTFFPNTLVQGDKWQIVVDAKLKLGAVEIILRTTTELEIVGFEDVMTPVGTFQNCAKIALKVSVAGPITLQPTTSYQWLAPNVGPIKYETSDGTVFEAISFKLLPPPVKEAQSPPAWQLPSLDFQVTGSRVGGILNAKILENVEDYVSEVHNLGMVAVTGGIVPPGDGTGFATNFERKQDLWVAGIFANAPIVGTITLFAENDKGRTPVTIKVTINQ